MNFKWVSTYYFALSIIALWADVQALEPNANGAYIGAYCNSDDSPFTTEGEIATTQSHFNNAPLKLVKIYKPWFMFNAYPAYSDIEATYKPDFDTIYNHGSIVHLAWEAWDFVQRDIKILDEINNGVHDGFIIEFAIFVKSYLDNPDNNANDIVIDLFHEANGDWYPWSPLNGTAVKGNPNKKYTEFQKAYRHVREIFNTQGADKVTWVISFNNTSSGSSDFTKYYPGDDYVDWLGLDAYNWGDSQSWSSWQTYDQMIAGDSDSYNQIRGFGKPLILAETACAELGGDKATWITDALAKIPYDFDAFVWFNINKESMWNIDSSPEARESFLTAVNYSCYIDSTDSGVSTEGCPDPNGDPDSDPNPDPGTKLHIAMLQGELEAGRGPTKQGIVHFLVKDENGKAVSDVTINGIWTGLTSKNVTQLTDNNGNATGYSGKTKNEGCFTYTMTNLVLNGYTYDSSKNVHDGVVICTNGPITYF